MTQKKKQGIQNSGGHSHSATAVVEPPPTVPAKNVQAQGSLLSWLHLAVTVVLLLVVLATAGLAVTGRLHLGQTTPASTDEPEEKKPIEQSKASGTPEGRYQIEQIDDGRDMLDLVGGVGYLGERTGEIWVFRYRGGFLEAKLETELEGKVYASQIQPSNWKSFLSGDQSIQDGSAEALNKQGYIVLTALEPRSLADALAPRHIHLNSLLAGGPMGPLHTLPALHLEVQQISPYRMLLTAGPRPTKAGLGFKIWGEDRIMMREPLVARHPAEEQFNVTVGKDFSPGKEFTLLDRMRGYSRIRLKVRFLGDSEVKDHAGK